MLFEYLMDSTPHQETEQDTRKVIDDRRRLEGVTLSSWEAVAAVGLLFPPNRRFGIKESQSLWMSWVSAILALS